MVDGRSVENANKVREDKSMTEKAPKTNGVINKKKKETEKRKKSNAAVITLIVLLISPNR